MTHADTGLTAFDTEQSPRNCFHPLITFKFTHTHYKSVKTPANLRSGLDNHEALTSLLLYAFLRHTYLVMYCTIQYYYTVLNYRYYMYIVLHYTVLHWNVMYCTIQYSIVLLYSTKL